MIPFEAEQWMTRYENICRYNLADTSMPSLQLKDLELKNLQDLFLDYGNIDGSDELKQAIASLYRNASAGEILPSTGTSQANVLILSSLLEPEEELVVFTPDYQQFSELAKELGCKSEQVSLDLEGQFNPEELEKAIHEKTRLIALSHPNNPMGTVLDPAHLEALVSIARKHDLWILSDEVYRLDEPSLSDFYEKAVSTSSLSKIYGAAGLRYGWIRARRDLIEKIRYTKDYHFISAGSLSEKLALEILSQKELHQNRTRDYLQKSRQLVASFLKDSRIYEANVPAQGNCLFLKLPTKNDILFCQQLAKEKQVLLVPGSFYGKSGYARFGLGSDHSRFEKGLQALEEFGKQWKDPSGS